MSARQARLHAATRAAIVVEESAAAAAAGAAAESAAAAGASNVTGPRWRVTSPSPGWFRPAVANGDLISASSSSSSGSASGGSTGTCIGELEVLGQLFRLVVPRGAGAVLLPERFAGRTRVPVAFGDELCTLDGSATTPGASASRTAATAADASRGLVIRAPSSGRFYGRPGPGKPAFLSAGDTIERGHTVCLLEVMKTFHRVTYDDPTLPDRARVVAILVSEESDVVAGQPLLEVEPA